MNHLIPRYYDKFSCIGSDCPETCCQGWKISIDKDTFNKYQKLDNKKLKHKSLLEIGSGYGTFGNLVITSNFFSKYLGIEPTPELSEVCKERKLKIINKKVEDVFLEEKFDIVVSFEVIEHIFNPQKFVRKINSFLKKMDQYFCLALTERALILRY